MDYQENLNLFFKKVLLFLSQMLYNKAMDKNRQLSKHILHSDFPFDIFRGIYTSDTENSVRLHSHDYCEIEIIVGGSAKHSVGDDHYPLRPGDVFVIGRGITHALTDAKDLQFYNISFDPGLLEPFMAELRLLPGFQSLFILSDAMDSTMRSRFRLHGKDLAHAESLCQTLNREYTVAAEGFKCAITSTLLSLVLHLSRYYSQEQDMFASSVDRISYVLAYIENNFSHTLTLEALAAKAKMSTRNFSRAFKAMHGQTPMDYILQLRISRAESLLKNSKHSITDIAYECGFLDSSYFSRTFRKRTGVSPHDYRKNAVTGEKSE